MATEALFLYEKFMPGEVAYMVKNWSFTSALLSGNQSQFDFVTLIAMETNYEQQGLKPLIKVGVNKMIWHYLWGNIGRMRDSAADFLSRRLSKSKETHFEGIVRKP